MWRATMLLGLALALTGCGRLGGVSDGGPPKGVVSLVYEADLAEGQKADAGVMKSLAAALEKRLDPEGEVGVKVRVVGDSQVDIRAPRDERLTVDLIKDLISVTGDLRFRITANDRDHKALIEAARKQASDGDRKLATEVKAPDGKVLGFWAEVPKIADRVNGGSPEFAIVTVGMLVRDAKTGDLVEIEKSAITVDPSKYVEYLTGQGIEAIEVLLLDDDGIKLGGRDIGDAETNADSNGQPCVAFTMRDAEATRRMKLLTTTNLPGDGFARQLAILLDNRVLVAPSIRGEIGQKGQITGRFTLAEVARLVAILKSGPLPLRLKPEPVSESVLN